MLRASPDTQIDIAEYPFAIFELVVILVDPGRLESLVHTRFTPAAATVSIPVAHCDDPGRPGTAPAGSASIACPPVRPDGDGAATGRGITPRYPTSRRVASWLAEARALVWETRHEGATTWCLLAVIGLAYPVTVLPEQGYLDPELDDADRHRRLRWWRGSTSSGWRTEGGPNGSSRITVHGPGLVWLVKLAVWCVGLALIWGPQAIVLQYTDVVTNSRRG